MKTFNTFFLSIGAIFLASTAAFANLVVSNPSGVGNWYSGVPADENVSNAFWDNRSIDGSECNIGYWLESTDWATGPGARCSNDSFSGTGGPGTPLSFFGGATAADPVGWGFLASNINVLDLRIEVAGKRDTNSFGYFTYDQAGNRSLVELFSGFDDPTNSSTETINITPGAFFGFYLCRDAGCTDILYSDDPFTGTAGDPGAGKFVLFSEVPVNPNGSSSITSYWVGVEDFRGLSGTEGWGDFNDFVIRATVIPEPGFYGMLALGLGGLFFLIQRRHRRQLP